MPTSGGITQARQRLGHEPLRELFSQVAVPVAGQLTRGAFLGSWRLMAIDGFEWDAKDSRENAEAFGYAGAGADRGAFPKVRVVTVSECASHAVVDAEIGSVAGRAAASRRWSGGCMPGWKRAETGNDQIETHLRGPGRILRSKSPDMVRQEIYGYLLARYAISALICRAATETDIDPDGLKFLRTVRIIRRQASGTAAFPLSSRNASSPPSWPTSPTGVTSTPPGGTAPTRA